jgi:hypothetical protein
MLTASRRKRLTPARRHRRGADRIATFWAHARWATPPGRWGTLTDFSFSSIFWEQETQTATVGIMSHLRVPSSPLFDAAGKRHRLYLGLVSSSRASNLSGRSMSAGVGQGVFLSG